MWAIFWTSTHTGAKSWKKMEKTQETEEAQYTAQQVCQRWLAEQSWRSAEPCAAPSAACFGPIIWSFFQQVEPHDAPSLFILYISSMSRKEFTCFEDQSQNLHSPFVAEVVGSFSSFFSGCEKDSGANLQKIWFWKDSTLLHHSTGTDIARIPRNDHDKVWQTFEFAAQVAPGRCSQLRSWKSELGYLGALAIALLGPLKPKIWSVSITLICLSRIEVFLVNPTCTQVFLDHETKCTNSTHEAVRMFWLKDSKSSQKYPEVSFSPFLRALVHQVRLISGCWCDGQSSSVAFRNDTMVTMISRMPRDHVERPGLSGFSWSCRRKVYVETNMRRKTKWVLCEGCKPGRFRQQKRVWQQRSTCII